MKCITNGFDFLRSCALHMSVLGNYSIDLIASNFPVLEESVCSKAHAIFL
jgi:hypothetical protein